MITIFTDPVVVKFDLIWNQLKGKQLGTPVRGSLGKIIWSGKTHLKCEWHLPAASQVKEIEGKCVFSLLAFMLEGSFFYSVVVTFFC